MKATYRAKGKNFGIWLFAAAAVCCFITHTAYRHGVSSAAANALQFVLTPGKYAAASFRGFINDKTAYFADVKALKEENDALRTENTALAEKVAELSNVERDNRMLSAFLGLKEEITDISFVKATVTARSSSAYTAEFTLDRGEAHGLCKDMAVLSEDGSLLGILVEVGKTYSRGRVLTSYDLSLGSRNERTGETGVVSGSFALSREGKCRVGGLRRDSDYQAGDIIRTSGLGDVYPAGILIGRVTELVPDELEQSFNAVVLPSETIFTTDRVMVVTDFARSFVPVTADEEP